MMCFECINVKTMKRFIAFLIISSPLCLLNAQDTTSTITTSPYQLSIIPPLSTNGAANSTSVNTFSLNLFAGYSGAINGFEAGAFANVVRDSVHGIEMAGFANVVGGPVEGAQMAGFCNVCQKDVKGVQFAGFTNVVNSQVDGLQWAGFANIVSKNVTGLQSAGFMNISNDDFKGGQVAGFLNHTGGSFNGVQASGFYNLVMDSLSGAQAAGFINVTAGRVKGAQISGFLNVAKQLSGTQLGVINLVDTLEKGTPFGFLSFVRKGGFMALELTGDETFYAGIQFKTGSNAFYNIINISGRPGTTTYWGWGYGVGSNLKSTGKFRINLDLTATHVNENELWTNHLNLLNRAKLGFTWQAAKHFALSAGPTFNVLVRKTSALDGAPAFSNVAPYSIYSEFHKNTRVVMWPGVHLSLRF